MWQVIFYWWFCRWSHIVYFCIFYWWFCRWSHIVYFLHFPENDTIRYDTIFFIFFSSIFFLWFFFRFWLRFFFLNFLLLLFFVVEIPSCFGFLRSLWYHFSDSLRASSLYILWHKESEFFWIFSSTAYHYMDVQGVASMVHADCISYQPHLPKMP